jgi:release factor glutamine methyltransferase
VTVVALPTVASRLAAAAAALAAAGVAFPRREATRTYAAVAGLRAGDVWLARERPVPPTVAARFDAAIAARLGGRPFAYAVGWVGFRGLELACDPRALIPRPETEGLVDLVLAARSAERRTRSGEGAGIAADLGTGTGCLALALATEGDFARVIAVERDPDAAALARENVARLRPAVPVEVREGDWLAPLGDARCDVIVANPPYLTPAEYDALDTLVKDHEPRTALVSGADGLADTQAILAGARARLAPGGVLALEIDERRSDAVVALAAHCGWPALAIHHDLFGKPRYAVAVHEETP